MIEFNKVSLRYANGLQALSDITFSLKKGEMAFLTGHSGAGKSTLLKLIMALVDPTGGQIIINGLHLRRLSRDRIPAVRRNIGAIFQAPHLLSDRSVFDNVALPLIIAGIRYQEIARSVRAALDKVGLLKKERCKPIDLSDGEKQRVGIARAVVGRPPILLADEPTGNLDPSLSFEIMELFQEFNRVGVSILIASHDLGLIARLKHRILILREGHLRSDGTD